MSDTKQLVVFGVVIYVLGQLLYFWLRRSKPTIGDKLVEEAKKAREREEHQKRDHQLNHGRRVYNWLRGELAKYSDRGVSVSKFEENGGVFTIFVEHTPTDNIPTTLVQIDYDFVGRTDEYKGHIHYGAYGADILFWVGDHAPFYCLQTLVIDKVDDYVNVLHKTVA